MVTKFLIGSTGVASAQIVDSIPTDGMPISEIAKIIIQLVIGIGTLIQMFKKPKTEKNNQNQNQNQ